MIRIAPLILSLILSTLLIPASGRAQGLQDVAQIQQLVRNGLLLESSSVLYRQKPVDGIRATPVRDRGRGGVTEYALMVYSQNFPRLAPVNSERWERVDLLSACLKARTEAERNDCVHHLRVVGASSDPATNADLNRCFAGKGKGQDPFLGLDQCLAEYGIVRFRYLPVFSQETVGYLTQGAGDGLIYFVRLSGSANAARGMDVECVERWATKDLRKGRTAGEQECRFYSDAIARSVGAVEYLSPLLLTPPVTPGSATLP